MRVAHFFIGHPVHKQIDPQRVVGQLLGLLGRMRPVAARLGDCGTPEGV